MTFWVKRTSWGKYRLKMLLRTSSNCFTEFFWTLKDILSELADLHGLTLAKAFSTPAAGQLLNLATSYSKSLCGWVILSASHKAKKLSCKSDRLWFVLCNLCYTYNTITSTVFGRLSTRLRRVFMILLDHSSRSAFVRSYTDVAWEGLPPSLHCNSFQRCSDWGQDCVRLCLRNLLCELVLEKWQVISRLFPESWEHTNCPKCLGVPKHSESLSVKIKGQASPLKKQQDTIALLPLNKVLFYWQLPQSDLSNGLQNEAQFVTPENVSTALEPRPHEVWRSIRINCAESCNLFTLCTEASTEPSLSVSVAYHFVAELLLLVNTSTLSTVVCGIFKKKGYFMTKFVAQVASVTISIWNNTVLLRAAHSFTKVFKSSLLV